MFLTDDDHSLVAGIQQYMFENSRIDNIFTDFYFESFTASLNEVLTDYPVRLNAQGMLSAFMYTVMYQRVVRLRLNSTKVQARHTE